MRIAVSCALKVPDCVTPVQPNAELSRPWPSAKDQVNDCDRVTGTHRCPGSRSAASRRGARWASSRRAAPATRKSTRMLALGDSELMTQHQDLGVLPPRLTARRAQQRHSPGNNQEDHLQAHKPTIIARPARPGTCHSHTRHATEPTVPRARICPGGTGFRQHPAVTPASAERLGAAGIITIPATPPSMTIDAGAGPIQVLGGARGLWRRLIGTHTLTSIGHNVDLLLMAIPRQPQAVA